MNSKSSFARFPEFRIALVPVVFSALLSTATNAPARAADTLTDALVGGKFDFSMRYRFEYVDQENPAFAHKEARANTLRTYLGYGTDSWNGFSLYAAGQFVRAIGYEAFNSTTNGRTTFPTIADPDALDLDQAYLEYASPWKTTAKIGRQRIIYDNHRWVGNVGFRQNEQTFDAARLINTSFPDFTLDYDFFKKALRINGPDGPPGANDGIAPMNSNLFHADYKGFTPVTIVGYAYLLDFIRRAPLASSTTVNRYIATNASASSATAGLRLTGEYPVDDNWKAVYTGEYARQSDYGDNPNKFGLNYYFAEGGAGYGPISAKAGYEVLEGNGRYAVQAPLSTLHLFQGWADQMLTTPVNGVQDLMYTVTGVYDGYKLIGVYHDFDFEHVGGNIGREWDASLSRTFADHVTAELIVADYIADNRVAAGTTIDTVKTWLSLTVSY